MSRLRQTLSRRGTASEELPQDAPDQLQRNPSAAGTASDGSPAAALPLPRVKLAALPQRDDSTKVMLVRNCVSATWVPASPVQAKQDVAPSEDAHAMETSTFWARPLTPLSRHTPSPRPMTPLLPPCIYASGPRPISPLLPPRLYSPSPRPATPLLPSRIYSPTPCSVTPLLPPRTYARSPSPLAPTALPSLRNPAEHSPWNPPYASFLSSSPPRQFVFPSLPQSQTIVAPEASFVAPEPLAPQSPPMLRHRRNAHALFQPAHQIMTDFSPSFTPALDACETVRAGASMEPDSMMSINHAAFHDETDDGSSVPECSPVQSHAEDGWQWK